MTAGGPVGRFAGGCLVGLLASSAAGLADVSARAARQANSCDRFGFMPPIVGRRCEWQKAWQWRSAKVVRKVAACAGNIGHWRASRFFNAIFAESALRAARDARENVGAGDRWRCKNVWLLHFTGARRGKNVVGVSIMASNWANEHAAVAHVVGFRSRRTKYAVLSTE